MTLSICENVSLRAHTTLKTGGVARYVVEVRTVEEVVLARQFAKQTALPELVLGGGSNVLVEDAGFAGLVILNKLKGLEYSEHQDGTVTLVCQSGELLDDVVADTVARGYWGLENLSAIPGTVGATPVQNVGAYGVEIGNIISKVEAYNLQSGEYKIFSNKECEFGYRDSFFKSEIGKKYFITAVHIQLTKKINPQLAYADLVKKFSSHTPTLIELRNAIIQIRSQKFPDWKVIGTAGSFFKNPIITSAQGEALRTQYPDLPQYEAGLGLVKIPLGYVLDKVCGLKGYRVGAVGLFSAQALVLVNYGGATTDEIKNFVTDVQQKVFTKTGINIFPEVRFIGNEK